MISADILYLSAAELGKRIQSKSLSPVELTKAYLDRSEKLGPKLNAYARLTPEIALEQAAAAEKEIGRGHYRGPLHGIPYAAKDLLATRGVATTWGAKPYERQMLDYDATVVENLRRAGAVLVGKAAMIELAGGMNYRFASASLEGAAKNPWNTSCWTCGSSSGSGAIVAAGLAAFAIGTETWGSIICPSAYCGVSGLRPTFGRVSRYGAMALSYSMDKIGPLARSAEDCAHVFAVIAGHDIKDLSTLPLDKAAFTYSPSAELSAKPLRVGWLSNAWKQIDAHAEKAMQAAERAVRRMFPGTRNAALPEGPFEAAGGVIIGVEGAAAFRDLIRSGKLAQLSDPLGQINGYVNEQIDAADYLRALQVRGILQQKMEALFDGLDVLVAAAQPLGANAIDANLETDLAFPDPLGAIGNLCGLPALSVPCGFTDQNLPVGLQFVARAGNDLAVVRAARTFQQRTEWHRKHPKLA
jgi:Asp-tRNA(Asn)/Glu-tRNA(Gln) amidotransferase A subunit family amidase